MKNNSYFFFIIKIRARISSNVNILGENRNIYYTKTSYDKSLSYNSKLFEQIQGSQKKLLGEI